MITTTRIQHKGQVTIPTHLREQAGLSKGDLVEFSFHRGKIIITSKAIIDRSGFPNADNDYTQAQRRRIDRGIAQSEKDYKEGRSFGPFKTHEAFLGSLHHESVKLRTKKNKPAGK